MSTTRTRRTKRELASDLMIENQVAGGVLLVAMAVLALLWANSRWADAYFNLWHSPLRSSVGSLSLPDTPAHWVNDGLMTVFFLMVGLEVRREFMVGELASRARAMLPIAAAMGGVLLPAAIYLAINVRSGFAEGWAIPTATDIAFALGVLALLGERAPRGLIVFITALAVVDDVIAVILIAILFTSDVHLAWLGAALAVLVMLWILDRKGVDNQAVIIVCGIALWVATLNSGIHPTLAGVALALVVPWNRVVAVEHALRPWATLIILPLFALANAGIELIDPGAMFTHRVAIGVFVGLVAGKPIGIALASWLAIRSGLASLPDGVDRSHLLGAGVLAGIGFTVSLFVTELVFDTPDLDTAAEAGRLGILAASLVAGVAGAIVLRLVSPATVPGVQER